MAVKNFWQGAAFSRKFQSITLGAGARGAEVAGPSRLGHVGWDVQLFLGFQTLGQGVAFRRIWSLGPLGADFCANTRQTAHAWQAEAAGTGQAGSCMTEHAALPRLSKALARSSVLQKCSLGHRAGWVTQDKNRRYCLGFKNFWQAAAFSRKFQLILPGAGCCAQRLFCARADAGWDEDAEAEQGGSHRTRTRIMFRL